MVRASCIGSFAVATLAALALAAALATIINAITAKTEPKTRRDCRRECHPGEFYICEYEFRLHRYQTYSWNCKSCRNDSCSNSPGCIEADGVTRLITVVNEQLPGPTIEVCEGDTVKVKVKNDLISSGISIHWHGVTMNGQNSDDNGTPYMDGEPHVTQCPIVPYSHFTYTFLAKPSGTHFWHSQTGFQRGDGAFGPMIVKKPKEFDENGDLYDEDIQEHVIMISDWTHIFGEEKFYLHLMSGFTDFPKSILINGFGPFEGDSIVSVPHPVNHKRFQVVKGTKYRFRVINSAFLNCPVTMAIEDHVMTVIASDGSSVQPVNVTSILIHPGERWDFVLEANQYPQSYWMSFMGHNDCVHDSVYQLAILDYVPRIGFRQEKATLPYNARPQYTQTKSKGKQVNEINKNCNSNNICLKDLKSTVDLPDSLKTKSADVTLFFEIERGSKNLTNSTSDLDLDGTEKLLSSRYSYPSINGFVHRSSPTPLLFKGNFPTACDLGTGRNFIGNKCLHIIKIPLGSVTDMFLIDEGKDDVTTSLHLHGFRFYVISEERMNKETGRDGRIFDLIREMESEGKITKNLEFPLQKDTISLPPGGYSLVRFLADNPGFWILESQMLFESHLGMKLILQVGEFHEIPNPPKNFPYCGSFPYN